MPWLSRHATLPPRFQRTPHKPPLRNSESEEDSSERAYSMQAQSAHLTDFRRIRCLVAGPLDPENEPVPASSARRSRLSQTPSFPTYRDCLARVRLRDCDENRRSAGWHPTLRNEAPDGRTGSAHPPGDKREGREADAVCPPGDTGTYRPSDQRRSMRCAPAAKRVRQWKAQVLKRRIASAARRPNQDTVTPSACRSLFGDPRGYL